MPSAIEQAALRWRRRLLENERAAASRMVRVYGESWQRVQAEIGNYTRRMATAPADEVQRLMHRREAAEQVRAAIERELRRFAQIAESETIAQQQAAVGAARRSVQEMVDAQGTGVFLRAPGTRAVEQLVGYASDGSPLLEVLTRHSAGRAEAMADLLAQNVALGINPRVTAREMRRQFGTGLSRALLTARTETLRAYREASWLTMAENDDVLDGWIWISACDRRSCPACFAMHGSWHPLTERMKEHPGGRCVAAPRVKGKNPTITPGADRFAALPAATQRTKLGNAMYRAYQDGAVTIAPRGETSLVGYRRSRAWGASTRVRRLGEIVGEEQAAEYREPAQ